MLSVCTCVSVNETSLHLGDVNYSCQSKTLTVVQTVKVIRIVRGLERVLVRVHVRVRVLVRVHVRVCVHVHVCACACVCMCVVCVRVRVHVRWRVLARALLH